MNRNGSMTFTSKKYFLPLLIFLVVGLVSGSASATEDAEVEQGQRLREVDKFQYKYENRPDPFLPFISKEAVIDPIDLVDDEPGKVLKGMQLFEPGQLKLVAVMSIGNKSIAMVEDIAGKGYRLDVGMPIGRNGVIHDISDEQVKITETSKTRAGRIIKKEIIMRLKKEGDK
ncbi:MAG: hypothetical protein D3924_17580 [Candidatus Electrothrix sp. AR4]|nr:hypothetical protein [Candidatus Electrothrix sp. AR4]